MNAFRNQRRVPIVLQATTTECGLACIAMVASFYGHDLNLAGLRRRFGSSMKGTNLPRLMEIARTLQLETRPMKAQLEYLSVVECPCILHWDMNHFVVLIKTSKRTLEIADPAGGRVAITWSEASKHFTGIILEIKPSACFEPIREAPKVTLAQLTGDVRGLGRALLQVLSISLAIELLALLMPLQVQWVVDVVLPGADLNLLFPLSLGFGLAVTLQCLLSVSRGWLVSWLGASVGCQWTGNLFSHLMNLPMEFFEKRHVAEIVSRFSSVQFVQRTLSGSFIEGMLNGAFGIVVMGLMFWYSGPLSMIVVASTLIYLTLRLLMYRRLWIINEEHLLYSAKEQNELIESIRGAQTIKLGNLESVRTARLQNASWEAAARDVSGQRLALGFNAISQFLAGIQRVAIVAFAARATVNGQFTAGALTAFVAFADQFALKMGSLVDKLVDIRMLNLHLQRIADIALCPGEFAKSVEYLGPSIEPRISVKGLSFRYSESDSWVLRELSLDIEAGECVALVGPSGCGKSTFAKLLLGLLTPTTGSIEIGGIDIRRYGYKNTRHLIGTVMQDDQLFAGSIAENISCGRELGSGAHEDIVTAARRAGIHEEIAKSPMGYETFVGDMGSALSGGQRQRIMLARALYKQPRILILDEATSHLDAQGERLINDQIRQMNVTRIIIAHREESIRAADRVVDLSASAVALATHPLMLDIHKHRIYPTVPGLGT